MAQTLDETTPKDQQADSNGRQVVVNTAGADSDVEESDQDEPVEEMDEGKETQRYYNAPRQRP